MPKGVYDRTERAEEVRRERRKKPGQVSLSGIKLSVDESKLDRNRYQYRFVNDKADRVRQLHAVDWDIAPEMAKEDTNSLGTTTTAIGGVTEKGPYNMVLMRKEKDWFEADQKEKMRPLDEMDKAILRGQTGLAGQELKGEGVYTPGQNVIERVSR